MLIKHKFENLVYYRTEKNATPWSKQRLKELLEGQKYENASTVVIFKELRKLDGEATANNRKAKLIFLFEWLIELTFEGLFLLLKYPRIIKIPENFS